MEKRFSACSGYVALPALSPSEHSTSYISTYAPPLPPSALPRPSSPPPALSDCLEEEEQCGEPLLHLQSGSSGSSSTSSAQSSRPTTSILRHSSHPHTHTPKHATFSPTAITFPPLYPSPSPRPSYELLVLNSSSPVPAPRHSSPSTTDRLLQLASTVLEESTPPDSPAAPSESRRRAGMLATLKRADRERTDMARELYDEVQIVLNEQAREEEDRRRDERIQRERDEERRRLKEDRRREKRDSALIQALTAHQMLLVLDSFPPSMPSAPPTSSAAPHLLRHFLDAHHSLHHLTFRHAPASSRTSPVMAVEWRSPPTFNHVLSRHLRGLELPLLHADLDVLDPSSSALLSFLRGWLASYYDERPSFSSLTTYLTLKLSEVEAITRPMARPNSVLTFVSIDALLLFVSTLDAQRAQVLLTVLLDVALLATYSKARDTGSGNVRVVDETYAVRVRVLEAVLEEQRVEHRAMLQRMQNLHEAWVRVLSVWQPCVARAVALWQRPILALSFSYWTAVQRRMRWRTSEARRSMSAMVRTMRRRWERRHTVRALFLDWRQATIHTRLSGLRSELGRLRSINGDKQDELDRLHVTTASYAASILSSERALEDATLRIQMMHSQHREYHEQLRSYGVQEEETHRLVQLFQALTVRLVEEAELSTAQLFYQRWQDVGALGDLDEPDDGNHSGNAEDGTRGASDGRDDRKKRSRAALASLLSRKKAAGGRRTRKEAQEQADSRSFLRLWTRHHYQRLANLFPLSPAPGADATALQSMPPQHAREASRTLPAVPSAFARAVSAGRRRRSSGRSGGAAAFLDRLREETYEPFALPPFTHPDAFLWHHGHAATLYEEDGATDEAREAARDARRQRQAQTRDGLSLQMIHLLSLAHPPEQQALPSLFSFLPELILPPSSLPALPSPYALLFPQPSLVKAYPFLLHSLSQLPSLFASDPGLPRTMDCDVLAASSLYAVQSFPCMAFDCDDDLLHLQELIGLARSFALQPSPEALTRPALGRDARRGQCREGVA